MFGYSDDLDVNLHDSVYYAAETAIANTVLA